MRLSSLLLLAAVCAAPSCASTGGSVPEALDAIRAEDIRSDLTFFADDLLAGRDTPSEGLRVSARFLRARLERLGWGPGAEDGYFYLYDLQSKRVDPERTLAALVGESRTVELPLGEDWGFSPRNLNGQDRDAALVYLGQGSEDDFAGADVGGKVVLLEEVEGQSWWPPYTRARSAGALGVVWLPKEGARVPFEANWDGWMTQLTEGVTGWPVEDFTAEGEGGFNSAGISRAAMESLFELAAGVAPGAGAAAPEVGTELSVRLRDRRAVDPDSPRVQVENVCGLWKGSDPELANEVILLTAHYDHVGVDATGIYNGADDNGSGSIGLLAVAEALREYGPLRRSVMLMWVSGEEQGLLGSRAWAMNPWLPEGMEAVCDINIDMIGRNDPKQLLITPTAEHEAYNGLTKLFETYAPLEGFEDLGSADAYYHRSDHAMFEQHMGLPVCFLFSDVHEDYHQVTDTVEKIDFDKIRRVSRLVVRMLAGLQTDELDL